MATVLITCQVEDAEKWENRFRTRGELFRKQGVSRVDFGIQENDHVACLFHVDDLDTYMKILDGPETAEAMENDGVKQETVKISVLDRRFDP